MITKTKLDQLVAEFRSQQSGGSYEQLPAPDAPTTVAVKIIDMLGEEVLVTTEV